LLTLEYKKLKHLPEVIKMNQLIKRFVSEEEGLTTVEYAIAGALVGLAVITSFTTLGTTVAGVIDGIVAVL
jgi:pilus assembly protein Flp/PilA